jgi:hypothetical protein
MPHILFNHGGTEIRRSFRRALRFNEMGPVPRVKRRGFCHLPFPLSRAGVLPEGADE